MIAALNRYGRAVLMVLAMVAATLSVSSPAQAKPASPNGSSGYCHFYRGHVHCHGVRKCKYIKHRGTWYWGCKTKHVRGDIRIGRGTRVVVRGYPGIRTVRGFNPGRGFRPNSVGHPGFHPGRGFGGRGPAMHGFHPRGGNFGGRPAMHGGFNPDGGNFGGRPAMHGGFNPGGNFGGGHGPIMHGGMGSGGQGNGAGHGPGGMQTPP